MTDKSWNQTVVQQEYVYLQVAMIRIALQRRFANGCSIKSDLTPINSGAIVM